MKNAYCFIDRERSSTLSKEEEINLLERIEMGDTEAREEFIERNISLVIFCVNSHFNTSYEDGKDLVSTGFVGLIKAVNTFDRQKDIKFGTYAFRCIYNEIAKYLRSNQKRYLECSYDSTLSNDNDGNTLTVLDTLEDKTKNIEMDYQEKAVSSIIREKLKLLKEEDRRLIELYFGFDSEHRYNQQELATLFHVSQAYVSKKLKLVVKEMELILIRDNVIEKHTRHLSKGVKY